MTEPTLLGTSYPVPPDRMPRLQHLRHMLDSGIDLGNDVVRELLDAVDAAEAARAALADEVAELRASLLHIQQQRDDLRAIFDQQVTSAVAQEREACARIVSAERGIFATVETRLMVDSIAAAIRARGEQPCGAVALSHPAASAAQERPQGGDAGKAPPAPHQLDSGMLHHCRRGTRQMPRNAEACPECGTKWSDYLK